MFVEFDLFSRTTGVVWKSRHFEYCMSACVSLFLVGHLFELVQATTASTHMHMQVHSGPSHARSAWINVSMGVVASVANSSRQEIVYRNRHATFDAHLSEQFINLTASGL